MTATANASIQQQAAEPWTRPFHTARLDELVKADPVLREHASKWPDRDAMNDLYKELSAYGLQHGYLLYRVMPVPSSESHFVNLMCVDWQIVFRNKDFPL